MDINKENLESLTMKLQQITDDHFEGSSYKITIENISFKVKNHANKAFNLNSDSPVVQTFGCKLNEQGQMEC